MKLEQCDKAPDHLRCVRLKGHDGECDNVSATAFNNVLQAGEDEFLYGEQLPKDPKWPKPVKDADCLTKAFSTAQAVQGLMDPSEKIVRGTRAPFTSAQAVQGLMDKRDELFYAITDAYCAGVAQAEPVNPRVTYSGGELMDSYQSLQTDFDALQTELGKVWDELHALGINGGGGMTAAEGVRQLIARGQEWEKAALVREAILKGLEARIAKVKACKKCMGCGLVETPVGVVVCEGCGATGVEADQ